MRWSAKIDTVSDPPEEEVPRGSVAVGRRVLLPRGAGPPFVVYVNGVQQVEGTDYDLRAGEVLFRRQILKEDKVGIGRWMAMYLGLFGTYRKDEMVDVQFRRSGKTELASDLEIRAD